MCFKNFLKNNKKSKNKKELQFEHVQVQLVKLLNENRALHVCLEKLHADLQGQLNDLKEMSVNNGSVYHMSFDYSPGLNRKQQSTLKQRYI